MNQEKLFENTIHSCKTNELVSQLAKQVIEDFETLNRILFKLEENFFNSQSKNVVLREMSQETDTSIRDLMARISLNIGEISAAVTDVRQIVPLDENNMENIMVSIMTQYLFTSRSITSNNSISENYSKEIGEIHTALGRLDRSINDYNLMADGHNWPRIKTESEAFSIAKQRINSQELPDNIS